MAKQRDDLATLRATLANIAPGTPLRDGLTRILRGRTGGLIVLGHNQQVEALSTGGFTMDVPFTATGLRELAKMDGAIVLDADASRIIKVATHLMPSQNIPSEETGTRHRTADRVAKQTGFPVISVSQSMHIIAVYVGDLRYVLEESTQLLSRANQALATLERYRTRFDEVANNLSALEFEDLVTVRDVAVVTQRLEMVTRIAREIDDLVLELGSEGRLLALQLEELITGIAEDGRLIVQDYLPPRKKVATILTNLANMPDSDLVDVGLVADQLGLPRNELLDTPLSSRGYRLLAKVPRLPEAVAERLVEKFGTLQKLLNAGLESLQSVEGVGELRARGIREAITRLGDAAMDQLR